MSEDMRRGRVKAACERCRGLKSKCGPRLPCRLCKRSGCDCVPPPTLIGYRIKFPGSSSSTEPSSSTGASNGNDGSTLFTSTMLPNAQMPPIAIVQKNDLLGAILKIQPGHKILTIKEAIGIELPPPEEVKALLSSYFTAMQWYLPIIEEADFRDRVDRFLNSKYCTSDDRSFLMLLLIVLVLGARFDPGPGSSSASSETGIFSLKDNLMVRIEANYWILSDSSNFDWITFGVLLSTHYMIKRQTRRSHEVLASATRAAQAMLLDGEENWCGESPLTIEKRRRIWWSLFCLDRYTSAISDKPSIINYSFSADMPAHHDVSPSSPPNHLHAQVFPLTTFSFHHYRYRLYQISTSLGNKSFGQKETTLEDTFARVMKTYETLEAWRQCLPPQFCLTSYYGCSEEEITEQQKLFRKQALILQAASDNIELMLFRPLAVFQVTPKTFKVDVSPTISELNIKRASQIRCWEAAKRTSSIDAYPEALRSLSQTPAITHLGVQFFAAGVMLGTLALSSPLSTEAQDCKRSLTRLSRVVERSEFSGNTVWSQSSHVLKEFLSLVGREEIKRLRAGERWNGLANQLTWDGVQIDGSGYTPTNNALASITVEDTGSFSHLGTYWDPLIDPALAQCEGFTDTDKTKPLFDGLGPAVLAVQQFIFDIKTSFENSQAPLDSNTMQAPNMDTVCCSDNEDGFALPLQTWVFEYRNFIQHQ